MRQAKNTDIPVVLPVRRAKGKPSWPGVVIALAGMAFVLGVLFLTGNQQFFHKQKVVGQPGSREDEGPSNEASRVDGTASLAFHRGDIAMLGLRNNYNGRGTDRENKIRGLLRTADQEYLKLELRYTKRVVNSGDKGPVKAAVTVMPFKNELKTLEDRVWGQLGVVFDQYPQYDLGNARKMLSIRGSLFPFGTEEVIIGLSQHDREVNGIRVKVFRWRFSKPGDPGDGQWFESPQLPPEYARFWLDEDR